EDWLNDGAKGFIISETQNRIESLDFKVTCGMHSAMERASDTPEEVEINVIRPSDAAMLPDLQALATATFLKTYERGVPRSALLAHVEASFSIRQLNDE